MKELRNEPTERILLTLQRRRKRGRFVKAVLTQRAQCAAGVPRAARFREVEWATRALVLPA